MLKSMTDAPLAPTAAPQTTAPADQNPLDALEAILEQAKASAGTVPDVDSNTPPIPDPAMVAAQEEAQKQAELERLQEENRARDAAKLQEELAALQNVGSTSADQARVAQNEARQQDQVQKAEEREEYSIHQLGHTKI